MEKTLCPTLIERKWLYLQKQISITKTANYATGYHAIAFLCPNNATDLTMKNVACTVDEVESMSKIDVYSYLSDEIEETIESQIDIKKWGIR